MLIGSSGTQRSKKRRSLPAVGCKPMFKRRFFDEKNRLRVPLNGRTVKLGPLFRNGVDVDWLPSNEQRPRLTSMANTGFTRVFGLPAVDREARHSKYYSHASVRTRMSRTRKVNTVYVDCIYIQPQFNATTFEHIALPLFLTALPPLSLTLSLFRFRRFENFVGKIHTLLL